MDYKRPDFEIKAGYGGAIAMVLVPEDLSEEIMSWSKSHINDSEVYGKDGKGRDGSPHITLQNGIMCDDADELERLFSNLPQMSAELGEIGVFRNNDKDYDVVHIEVISDELHGANSLISDILDINNPLKEYRPHITLCYVNRGAGKRFEGIKDFFGKKIDLSRLVVDGPSMETRTIKLMPHEHMDQLSGGNADKMEEGDFDQESLEEGSKHELEHTKNIEIAREIAMDHLSEDPDYYKKLKKIEASKKCKRCREGKKCDSCEPLKESLDYGSRRAAYDAEDLEDYLLDSGQSIHDISQNDLRRIIRDLRNGD